VRFTGFPVDGKKPTNSLPFQSFPRYAEIGPVESGSLHMDTRRALIEALEHLADSQTADSFSGAFAFLRGYITTRSYSEGRDEELNAAFDKAQKAIIRRRQTFRGRSSR
jgi:hypothetical protein